MLSSYSEYLNNNMDSLLCRIYGMHKVYLKKKAIRVLVMENILDREDNPIEVYDLKGSTVGRKATDIERKKGNFKDKDLLLNKRKLVLPKNIKEPFLDQLSKDCKVLQSLQHKINKL